MNNITSYINERLKLSQKNIQKAFEPESLTDFNNYIEKQKAKSKKSNGLYGTKDEPINLSNINFEKLYNNCNDEDILSFYFSDDDELGYIDVSDWDFSTVKQSYKLPYLFGNSSIIYINVSDWKFNHNFHNLSGFFRECKNLKEIEGINNWDTQYIHKISGLFCGCESLTSMDLSNWDTSNVIRARRIFDSCTSLKTVNLKGWKTKSMSSFEKMFCNCKNLTEIEGIEDFDVQGCSNFEDMFFGCKNLNINIDNWQPSASLKPDFLDAFTGSNIKPIWYSKYINNN